MRALALSVFALACGLALPQALLAQVDPHPGPLPAIVQDRAVTILNDSATLRTAGRTRIPAGSSVSGTLAVLSGSVEVGGEILGGLLVVNGDLRLLPGARVSGDLLVVGGRVMGAENALLEGAVEVFAGPLHYRVRDGRVQVFGDPAGLPGFLASDLGFGRARFTLRSAGNYNRVEGLPVVVGPLFETAGRNPLSLEAFAIWRSISGVSLNSEELGYSFRLRQAVGGTGTAFLTATAFSDVHPIERRGLSDTESSLSTFLLRRDYRDYYAREGWSVSAAVRPAQLPLFATVGYRDERHRTATIGNPWTLRDTERPWRALASASEGTARLVTAEAGLDTRNDPEDPSDGWWLTVSVDRQVGGELLATDPSGASSGEPLRLFTRGSVDLRRFARINPSLRMNLRGRLAGALTDAPLPNQFQYVLGGEGSLPGHRRFSVDCGARGGDVLPPEEFYPAYGCDRIALVQVEVLGLLPFSWDPDVPDLGEWEWSSLLRLRPAWSLFFNAGRGWVTEEGYGPTPRMDSPTRADAGVGLYVGPLTLYWAYPLNRKDRNLNFFVRLQQRF